MVDITEISAMVAAAGVLVGVAYYILDMRNQTRIRKTNVVMGLVSAYNTKEFAEAVARVWLLDFGNYEEFVKKYGGMNSPNPDQIALRMEMTFFEQIGTLLAKRLVEPDLVFDIFPVKDAWEKIKPFAEGVRKESGEPRLLQWFEYLYNESKKYDQKSRPIA